jgi:hypothetical protein
MDREFILKASQDYYINNNIKSDIITDILKDYCCVEHNKDKDSTEILIQILLSNFPIFHTMFEYALEYYENKFNIIKIKQENKIIKIY